MPIIEEAITESEPSNSPAATIENVPSNSPMAEIETPFNVSACDLTTAINEAIQVLQDMPDDSSNVMNFSQVNDEWKVRAEVANLSLETTSFNNLFNEAIESFREDAMLTSALNEYLAPELEQTNSVALSRIDDELWPELDFSLFDLEPNDHSENDTNDVN